MTDEVTEVHLLRHMTGYPHVFKSYYLDYTSSKCSQKLGNKAILYLVPLKITQIIFCYKSQQLERGTCVQTNVLNICKQLGLKSHQEDQHQTAAD